jgi:hypothetical protein
VEVVEQQLLVDPGALSDPVDPGAVEAASSELLSGGCDDP